MRPPGNHTDAELVALLNNGDKGAFELIYHTYVSELYRYARFNISIKEDCEEIVQEVFESLWIRHKTLRIESLRFYLRAMVRYNVIRYFHTSRIRKKYAEHFLLFEAVYEENDGQGIEPSALQSMMYKAIAELPGRCQEALKLRLTEDLSNGAIAKRMNITKRTVEVYMLRASNHFRSAYKASLKRS